jgi:hypothetical protein
MDACKVNSHKLSTSKIALEIYNKLDTHTSIFKIADLEKYSATLLRSATGVDLFIEVITTSTAMT